MVLSFDGESDAPPELLTAWQCERWRCLPEIGGYYDQDYYLMQRMASLSNVYNALNKLRNSRGTAIHNLTEAERKILKHLVDLGLLFSG